MALRARQRASLQTAAERLALEQFRDDVRRARVGADIVDRQDVRVIELPGGARLLLEAMQPARVRRERLGDQLDRDLAPEPWIARAVDLAHAAGAEPADDLIGTDAGAGRRSAWERRGSWRGLAPASPSTPRCAHMEGHEQRPDADGIAIGELDRRGDALAAAKRAVLAAEILEHRSFGRHHQPRVTAGDRRCVEPDLDIGIASDDVFPG